MDPFKALADLDATLATAPFDRTGHAHIIRCVAAIKDALAAKPAATPSE